MGQQKQRDDADQQGRSRLGDVYDLPTYRESLRIVSPAKLTLIRSI
jgi:hypothetical protein